MMILTSPMSAASSSQVIHFSGLIAPAAWGAPFQPPGSPPPPGPGPFPPPPLLVVLFPTDGQIITGQGSVHHGVFVTLRSEEHTSELQSRSDIVCRLLLEKKKPFTQ